MGIDSLVIDEAHMYKNSAQTYDFKGARYLPEATASRRGIDAQAKAWYIRGASELGDGVLMLTATPITNSPIEIYSMLSLAVGQERVNDACLGIHGADDFMETMCRKETEEEPSIDGTPKLQSVFVGLNNLGILRKALGDVATIKTAEDVGASVVIPEREEKTSIVRMDDDTVGELNRLKNAYRYASAMSNDREPPIEYIDDFEEVQAQFGEPTQIIGHPFNLIKKMAAIIADPELVKGASFYQIQPGQEGIARKVIDEFNAKKLEEKRKYIPQNKIGDPNVREIEENDEETKKKVTTYKVKVTAQYQDGETPQIRLESTEFRIQDAFEEIAAKHGLDLDVHDSPKLSAMIENFKDEMAHPRGMIADGVKSPIVKQIIFCDMLGLHSKIRLLLQKRCGISASKIAIVTGQTNNTPEEIQGVQDGFNAQGEENRYQVIIANEKAEVGINLQKGTQAIHHLTIGWTPDSLEQRNGRGARQGNKTQTVRIYYYDADGSFDVLKRKMVNAKNDWITNVTDLNGGDKVTVSGGLSNEDYDMLIRSSGDPNAMKRFEEEKAQREAFARAEGNRERQRINLDTIAKQRDFLKKYDDVKKLAVERVTALWAIDNACQKLKKQVDKPNPSANNVRKYDAMTALRDAKAKEIDASIRFFKRNGYSDENLTPIDNAVAFIEEVNGGWRAPKNAEDAAERMDSRMFELQVDESSALYGEWQSSVDQANGMIEQSVASYEEQAKEKGGLASGMADGVRNGTVTLYQGYPVMSGMFVRADENLGTLIVYDENRCRVRFYDGKAESFTRDFTFKYELVYPGTAEYSECLKQAAAIEDEFAQKGVAFAAYSQEHKDVGQYRKTETLVEFDCFKTSLPAPYFPYVVTHDEAEKCPACAAIAREQNAVVKATEGRRYSVVSTLEVYDDDETGNYWSSARNKKFVSALVDWASAHSVKAMYRYRMRGWEDYIEENSDRVDLSPLNEAKTAEELDETAWNILREAFPAVDFNEISTVDEAMPESKRYDLQQIRKNLAQESISDDKIVGITGDTYRLKDEIKRIASTEGHPAKWHKWKKAWLVQYSVYKKLIEKHPEAANDLTVLMDVA